MSNDPMRSILLAVLLFWLAANAGPGVRAAEATEWTAAELEVTAQGYGTAAVSDRPEN